MKTGEKIKKLRTEKAMTQSELAGTQITRNMLSLIESGSAQPSLQTIIYLAERLNVPAGILIADDDDEYFYRRTSRVNDIRRAFKASDYRICLDMCLSMLTDLPDDELELICAECYLALAKEAFVRGNLKLSCNLFESACERAALTVYDTARIQAETAVYFDYMSKISQTIYYDYDRNVMLRGLAEGDRFCRYAMALDAISSKNIDAERRLREISGEDVLDQHLSAKFKMATGDFANAYSIMLILLNGDTDVPAPVVYDIFCDLEICCREIGDFKGAYEYSSSKMSMLQRLLDEDTI